MLNTPLQTLRNVSGQFFAGLHSIYVLRAQHLSCQALAAQFFVMHIFPLLISSKLATSWEEKYILVVQFHAHISNNVQLDFTKLCIDISQIGQ
jgi:hypothetical protein